jgi:hypothetical protein
LPDLVEGFLDAPGAGGADALIDGKCLFQAGGGFAGVAVMQVAVSDALPGSCFLQRRAEVDGDGQRLDVVVTGLAASAVRDASSPRQFSVSACQARMPASRLSARACWWLAAAAG